MYRRRQHQLQRKRPCMYAIPPTSSQSLRPQSPFSQFTLTKSADPLPFRHLPRRRARPPRTLELLPTKMRQGHLVRAPLVDPHTHLPTSRVTAPRLRHFNRKHYLFQFQ